MQARSTAAQAARRRKAKEDAARFLAGEPAGAQYESDFPSRRLVRVREHLDRLDLLLSTAKDPKVLRDLAEAAAKLQTQERELAGRPLPGSRRPPREEPIRQLTTRPRGLPPPPARPAQEPPPSPAPSTIDDEPDEPDGLQSEPID